MIANAANLLAQRAATQAADPNLPVERVAQLMLALAEMQRAMQPRYLMAADISDKIVEDVPNIFVNTIPGHIQLLVHDGKVIPKAKWTWDKINGYLHLIGLSGLDPAKVTEVYYLAD